MIDYENYDKWVNQELYSYTDKIYGSYSTFRMSVTQSIGYKLSKSPLMINISITTNADKRHRTCILKYNNIVDIYLSLQSASKDPDSYKNNSIVSKRLSNTKALEFKFTQTPENENIIMIQIIFGDNDFGHIILPVMEFLCFYAMLKEFKSSYISSSLNLLSDSFSQIMIIDEMNDLKNEIKELKKIAYNYSSKDVSIVHEKTDFEKFTDDNQTDIENNEVEELTDDDTEIISDFDQFVSDNIDTIIVPGIDAVERELKNEEVDLKKKVNLKPDVVINSDLFKILLNNDASMFKNLTDTIFNSNNMYSIMKNLFESRLGINIGYDNTTSTDVKSHQYIAKYICNYFIRNWDTNQNHIPVACPPVVLRYNHEAKKVDEKTLTVIYDLLFIQIYIRCMRNKLMSKVDDQQANYSILNLKTRLVFDPLILMYRDLINIESLKNSIIERFKNYKDSGFFNNFEKEIDDYMCIAISPKDILDEFEQYFDKVDQAKNKINVAHNTGYQNGSFKVPYNNVFSFEQISNECVDCEVENMFKQRPLNEITQNPDILRLFEEKKVVKPRIINQYSSHLHRIFLEPDFNKEIPSSYRDEFIEYVKSRESNTFDIEKYSLEELGEGVVKSIYRWNNTDDSIRGKGNYTDFRFSVEETMSKELILAKIKGEAKLSLNSEPLINAGEDWMSAIMQ